MLEHPSLCIEPFRDTPQGRCRIVRDASTLTAVGRIVRIHISLRPVTIAVLEGPDGSLLTTVRRNWWFSTPRILDADNEAVAAFRCGRLQWPDGRIIANRVKLAPERFELQSAADVELARWIISPSGLRLTFHPRIVDEPLIKMAILGAVISHH